MPYPSVANEEAGSMAEITSIDESTMIVESGESPFNASFTIQDSEGDGPRRVSGWFGPLSQPNGNMHYYTEEKFQESVEDAKGRLQDGRIIGQIRHPTMGIFSSEPPDPAEWCVRWTDVSVKDDKVHYEGVVMDTPAGKLFTDIADSGVNWLVSPRGRGKKVWVEPEETSDDDSEDEGYYQVDDYQLLAIDFTLDPAFAEQECVMESIQVFNDATQGEANEEDEGSDDPGPENEEGASESTEEEPETGVDEPENDEETLDVGNEDSDDEQDDPGDEVDEPDDTIEDEPADETEDEQDEDVEEEDTEDETEEDTDDEPEDEEQVENNSDTSYNDSDPSIDTEGNDSVDESNPEEEINLDQFDQRTMSILRGTALTDFAREVVDGWISEGEVGDEWRDQAVDMIKTDAESIEDAEANAKRVLPIMRKASAIELPTGNGVVESPMLENIEALPNSIDDVIAESVAKMPDGIKSMAWDRVLANYKGHPQNERVLATHTQTGRKMMADATYSNVDLVYTDFVLPIIERAWIELKGPELVATFPVKSPQGFIPKLFFEVDGASGTYLEDYYYKYFDHTEGDDKKEAKLSMSSQTYSVEERAIAFEWSDNLAYDLQQLYGRDAENMLTSATARRLSNEIDMAIVDEMIDAATASASTVSFGTQPPGDTHNDVWWSKGFQAHLTALETMIYEESFTHPNFILCGQNAFEMLMMSGDMITANRDVENERATYGLNYSGVFQGRFDIYYTTYMPNDQAIMGHAPSELSTAGVVFLPYVLGIMTDRSVNPKSNTMERAIHSRYGLERLNDEVYGLMNVWNAVGAWPF